MNERMRSDESETGAAQKALTCSRREIATRVIKSGAGAAGTPRQGDDRKQGGELGEESS